MANNNILQLGLRAVSTVAPISRFILGVQDVRGASSGGRFFRNSQLLTSPLAHVISSGASIGPLARSGFCQSNVTAPLQKDEFVVLEQNLFALCKANRKREAIAEALDYFDDRLLAGQFRDCDRALRQLQVAKLASSVMVSILGITIRAKQLKSRALFFDRVFREVARQKGKRYANELLLKYR